MIYGWIFVNLFLNINSQLADFKLTSETSLKSFCHKRGTVTDFRKLQSLSLLTRIKSNHLCSSVLVDRHQRSRDIIIVPESFCLNPRHLVSSVSCQWLEEDHLVDSERCQVSDWWPDGECQLNVTCGYNTITTCNLHSREGWKSEKTGSWPNTSNLLYDPHHPLQQLPNTDWLTDWVSKWLTHQLTEECMRKILVEPGEDWEKNCKFDNSR